MFEVIGALIAFLGLLWAVVSFFISSKEKKLDGPALLEIASKIPPAMSQIMLQDFNQTCCYCRDKSRQVYIYALSFKGAKKSRREELVVLCPDCAKEIQNEHLPASYVRTIKRYWIRMNLKKVKSDEIEKKVASLYEEAIRYSLLPGSQNLVIAKLKCQEILNMYAPYHNGAKMLLQNVIEAQKRMIAIEEEGEFRLHDIAWARTLSYKSYFYIVSFIFLFISAVFVILFLAISPHPKEITVEYIVGISIYIVIYLSYAFLWKINKRVGIYLIIYTILPTVFNHEFMHIVAAYLTGYVKNTQGKRMPLLMMVKRVEVNDLPFSEGMHNVIEKNLNSSEIHLPSFSINFSKLQREWYAKEK